MQDGTPIFIIRILAQFVSHVFFLKKKTFHTQNVVISKTKHILNTEVLK